MWPDIYFVANYFNNKYWPANTPGGGGGLTPSEDSAAYYRHLILMSE